MRIFWIIVAAALLGGLGTALYNLLAERAPQPTAVVDPQDYRSDGEGLASAPLTPDAPAAKPAGEEAMAQRLCASRGADTGGVATLFGHFKQPQIAAGSLASVSPSIGSGNCTQIRRDAAGPLAALFAAARAEAPEVGGQLYGLSCFRSVPRQADLYCKPDRIASRGYAGQARWVAPPGFSEHATGASLDFGNRNGNCNLDPCFAGTPAGRWLAANAARFGFRMSFPQGNAQGVSYEPWHFRYVGGGRDEGRGPPPVPVPPPVLVYPDQTQQGDPPPNAPPVNPQ